MIVDEWFGDCVYLVAAVVSLPGTIFPFSQEQIIQTSAACTTLSRFNSQLNLTKKNIPNEFVNFDPNQRKHSASQQYIQLKMSSTITFLAFFAVDENCPWTAKTCFCLGEGENSWTHGLGNKMSFLWEVKMCVFFCCYLQ